MTTPFERVLGLRPDLLDRYREFDAAVFGSGLVDPAVLELCRARVAQLHGSGKEAPRPPANDLERACLNYAEKFVLDVHSITDEDADAVKAEFTEAQFVAFSFALALLDGMGRFRLVLDAN